MIYLIDQNDDYKDDYSRDEIQKLIDENKIGLNTEIWTESWNKWKKVNETDFNLEKAINVRIKKKRNYLKRDSDSKKAILVGAIWFILGVWITVGSYREASNGGTYYVAWGAIIYGFIKLFKGLANEY
jgi:hypothetical protein